MAKRSWSMEIYSIKRENNSKKLDDCLAASLNWSSNSYRYIQKLVWTSIGHRAIGNREIQVKVQVFNVIYLIAKHPAGKLLLLFNRSNPILLSNATLPLVPGLLWCQNGCHSVKMATMISWELQATAGVSGYHWCFRKATFVPFPRVSSPVVELLDSMVTFVVTFCELPCWAVRPNTQTQDPTELSSLLPSHSLPHLTFFTWHLIFIFLWRLRGDFIDIVYWPNKIVCILPEEKQFHLLAEMSGVLSVLRSLLYMNKTIDLK